MRASLISPVNLLGALLVDEGLLTQAQLIACLMIQKEDADTIPLGQIAVRCGYLSDADLNRVLTLQQEVRNTLIAELDAQDRTADIIAFIMVSERQEAFQRYLLQLGVRPYFAEQLPAVAQAPDLVLIDQNSASMEYAGDPIVGLLPTTETNCGQLLEWEQQLIRGYVHHARERNHLRAAAAHGEYDAFQLQQFSTLVQRVSKATSKQDMLVQLMLFVRDAINVEAGTLYEIDQDARELIFSIVVGPHQNELYNKRLSIDHGIAGWVARNSEPLLIPDVHKDQRFEQMFDKKTGFHTQSVLCIPIHAQHVTLGVIQLINKVSEPFNEYDLFLLQMVAGVGSLVYLLFDMQSGVASQSSE